MEVFLDMDQEHLHSLVKELIDASEMLTDMVSVFGEDSDQARQADVARYVRAAANYHREHYWGKILFYRKPLGARMPHA